MRNEFIEVIRVFLGIFRRKSQNLVFWTKNPKINFSSTSLVIEN